MRKIYLNKTELLNLASRITDGVANDDEIRRYNIIYRHFQQLEATPLETEQVKLLGEQMIEEINHRLFPPAGANIRLWITRIAASVILICSVALGFYFLNSSKKDSDKQIDIVPGGNKAILTLANGKKVILDATHGVISKEVDITVSNATNGIISYEKLKSVLNGGTELEYNTIETPRGGTYRVNLSDGTKVWLNSASRLRYPVVYSKGERVVELEGEAYFEVAKDGSQPFKVKSKGQVVQVLGTHFNVMAYTDDQSIKTTLLEGSVKVSDHGKTQLLKPGQQAQVGQNSINLLNNIDIEEVVAWKNGEFKFNESLGSILNKIARWYDVEIVYQITPDPNLMFSGKISRSRNISGILKMLEYNGDVHFKVEGRRVIVTE